jgi:hypothetical protein
LSSSSPRYPAGLNETGQKQAGQLGGIEMKNKWFKEVTAGLGALGVSLIAFGGSSAWAAANTTPPVGSVARDQSAVASVVLSPIPPADMDPLSASDEELAEYGYPPRPNAEDAPEEYAHWQKLVSVKRVANPKLSQTTIFSGLPQQVVTGEATENGSVATTTTNWSAYAVTAADGTFSNNDSSIFSEWIVPIAQQAFGVCNGGWDYSFEWDGFDGAFFSSDVLQAGTEADAYCSSSSQSAYYSSWIEWYPNAATRVSAPAAEPGDLMGSEVWYTTTAPYGHAYLVNYTLDQSGTYSFNPPPGTIFEGDTAEWVVERPTVGGRLPDLTNYIADPLNDATAYDGADFYYPSASPSGTTIYAISMRCPPWTPSSSCSSTSIISSPDLYGTYALWFYDSVAAY